MKFLIPRNKIAPNTSYYTYSDLNSDTIEVWFDRCDRNWIIPITGIKRLSPDNAISKEFTKEQFNELFSIGKQYPEEMIPWKNIING